MTPLFGVTLGEKLIVAASSANAMPGAKPTTKTTANTELSNRQDLILLRKFIIEPLRSSLQLLRFILLPYLAANAAFVSCRCRNHLAKSSEYSLQLAERRHMLLCPIMAGLAPFRKGADRCVGIAW